MRKKSEEAPLEWQVENDQLREAEDFEIECSQRYTRSTHALRIRAGVMTNIEHTADTAMPADIVLQYLPNVRDSMLQRSPPSAACIYNGRYVLSRPVSCIHSSHVSTMRKRGVWVLRYCPPLTTATCGNLFPSIRRPVRAPSILATTFTRTTYEVHRGTPEGGSWGGVSSAEGEKKVEGQAPDHLVFVVHGIGESLVSVLNLASSELFHASALFFSPCVLTHVLFISFRTPMLSF